MKKKLKAKFTIADMVHFAMMNQAFNTQKALFGMYESGAIDGDEHDAALNALQGYSAGAKDTPVYEPKSV